MLRQPCDLHRVYNSGCPACKLKFAGVLVPAEKVAEILEVPDAAADPVIVEDLDEEDDVQVPLADALILAEVALPTTVLNPGSEPAGDVPLTDDVLAEETVRVDDDEADNLI